MFKDKTILGVITARGGSKGIPHKNIKDLCGKPLIVYTIDAVKGSKYLDKCIVSTDDKEIAEISKKYGGEVPFLRPVELADDSSKSIDVAIHALKWFKENDNKEFDYLMILQPTSPLRTSEDIDKSIEKIVDTDADSVMSMVELTDFSTAKLKKIEGDIIFPIFEDEGKISSSRQELSRVYKRNCAIYLTKTELILQGDLFGKISRPYIMPPTRSVDINTMHEFELSEFFIKKLNK